MTRTHDLLITNQLHYRLCYTSIFNFYGNASIIAEKRLFVKFFFQKSKKKICFFQKRQTAS